MEKKHLIIDEIELQHVKDIVSLYKPFKKDSDTLSADKYVIISLICLIFETLTPTAPGYLHVRHLHCSAPVPGRYVLRHPLITRL